VAAAIYVLRLDRVAGLVVDDAWYILLARSLAAGTGYGLVNSPAAAMVLPPNPPGFAAVLSLVFAVKPSFPENVLWLKFVGVASMFGVGVLTYRYAVARSDSCRGGRPAGDGGRRDSGFRVPRDVHGDVRGVLHADAARRHRDARAEREIGERRARRDDGRRARRRRRADQDRWTARSGWRRALPAVAQKMASGRHLHGGGCLLRGPVAGLRARARADAGRAGSHGGAHAFTYSQEFWMRWAGMPTAGTITWRDLPSRVEDGLVDVFGRDVAGIVVPVMFRPALESGEEVISVGGGIFPASMGVATGTMAVSFALSAIVILGFVALIRATGSRARSSSCRSHSCSIVTLARSWASPVVLADDAVSVSLF
jgi:hypothetical protein